MERKLLPISMLIIATLAMIIYGCSKDDEPQNSPPSIQSITSMPNTSSSNRLPAGDQVTISVTATDPDKDNLSYSWEADGGNFIGSTTASSVNWESPISTEEERYKITVTVSDGAETDSDYEYVYVDKEEVIPTAKLTGYVFYASTTIPVSGVLVSVSESSSTTGSEGYYEIDEAPQGTQTITATKEGYDTYSSNIQISSGTNEYHIEMTSALYTHNLYGDITNQIDDPVSGVMVVVLNLDGTESNLKTTSSSSGYYQIPTVPQGERTVRFIKETCELFEIDIFMANSNYELDVELQEYGVACPEEPTVNYEGQIYNTVLIGNQCWLKENLNVGQMIDGDDGMEDNEIIEKYCYNDNPSNCNTYGALYQWDEMMQYAAMQGTRGICPPNWHIPTDQEWKILEGHVDSQYPVGDTEWDDTYWRGYDAGERLKTQNGWNNNGNGTDLFGFSALPGGNRNGSGGFNGLGEYGTFWSSTEYYSNYAWGRYLRYNNSEVYRYDGDKDYGRSVRCVRD